MSLNSKKAILHDYILLLKDPQAGPVIEGTGGMRKVRFAINHRGKSGSIRVCYLDLSEYEVIYLITAYAKKDQENLTKQERNILFGLIKSLTEYERDRRR